jgi:ATP-dependent DNA ligase
MGLSCPQAFLNEAVDAATEGLIVKTLTDTYEPSKRSSHWLKVGHLRLQSLTTASPPTILASAFLI